MFAWWRAALLSCHVGHLTSTDAVAQAIQRRDAGANIVVLQPTVDDSDAEGFVGFPDFVLMMSARFAAAAEERSAAAGTAWARRRPPYCCRQATTSAAAAAGVALP
jgi:pentose-5-phosphate-3-epimerase